MNEIKDMIEWLFAPILAAIVFLGKILHSHGRSISRHETAIAVLVNGHEQEAEKRTEQRAELIETMRCTERKVDGLATRINDLLIELAKQGGRK